MANHVHTYIKFYRLSEEGKRALKTLVSSCKRGKLGEIYFSNIDIFSDTSVDMYISDPEWNKEFIGCEWCDISLRDTNEIVLKSAWMMPERGIETIMSTIAQVDPDFIATLVYEDDMPLFYGAWVITSYNYVKSHWVWHDLIDQLLQEYDELKKAYDYNTEMFTQDGYELLYDVMWDTVNYMQENFITHEIAWIQKDT